MKNDSLEKIIECINNKKSFCFNSGAGSGKTHSLIETVKYMLNNREKVFSDKGQKILVITYTNAAADEIKGRLGNTSVVDVSTIHNRLWNSIQQFQMALVDIHKNNLRIEIEYLKSKLSDDKYDMYRTNEYEELLKEDSFKETFCNSYHFKAKEVKDVFKDKYDIKINNVKDFKDYFKWYYKKLDYEFCVNKTKVDYNPLINYDRLEKMEFSHDTLLKYALELYKNNKIARRIFGNEYPVILVDEYQDTDPKVIKILKNISESCTVTIGFYGDVAQNIYDKGIGACLYSEFDGLEKICKKENWRSLTNVIDIGNKIRNDDLNQKSMKKGSGIIEVYHCKYDENLYNQVDSIKTRILQKDNNAEIGCLFLKNDIVAKQNNFQHYYNVLKTTTYYKDNYNNMNNEILSNDFSKLGKVPAKIFKFIEFWLKAHASNTIITSYLPKTIYSKCNYCHLKKIIDKLRNVNGNTIQELVTSFIDINNNECEVIFEKWFGEEFYKNYGEFEKFLKKELFSNRSSSDTQKISDWLSEFNSITLEELKDWYDFLILNTNDRVSNITFHGSKGREFDNVILVITNDFAKKHDYFRTYFENITGDDKEIIKKRNLLYVAVTRAKQNLFVIYQDDNYELAKDGFEYIFGNNVIEI